MSELRRIHAKQDFNYVAKRKPQNKLNGSQEKLAILTVKIN